MKLNGDTKPATLVMDAELENLKAQAEGSKPFRSSGLYERLAALNLKEFYQLPPRERLAVGFYIKRRSAGPKPCKRCER